MDDHDRLVQLEQKFDDYVEGHKEVHGLEREARALALAALKSQTTLVFAILGVLVAAGAFLVSR